MDLKIKEWNESYRNKDNYLFYPHEEVIRFISKYIKKRVGFDEYDVIRNMSKCLDLGCGIGRHVIYLDDMGFDVYGIDISDEAIDFARLLCKNLGKNHLIDKFTIASITNMPYKDDFFDFVISHGVLDSMPFTLAKKAIQETYRIMRGNGLLYFDVVSGYDYEHYREYDGEETVGWQHEKGTIQSYFNWHKVNLLLEDKFRIIEAFLIQRESVISRNKNSRYHIIAEKIITR